MKMIIFVVFITIQCVAMENDNNCNNNNNSNTKTVRRLIFITREKKQFSMSEDLIPKNFLAHNKDDEIKFKYSFHTLDKLCFLLEHEARFKLPDFELQCVLFPLFAGIYQGKTRYIKELIEAGIFLKVSQNILEVCIRQYMEKSKNKSKENRKRTINKFSSLGIDSLLHKWYFLCVDSQYILEQDDFSVSWQEIQHFLNPYLEDKFYRRAPLRQNSISRVISLAGFHLDSTILLKQALENRRVVWSSVQKVDLKCNKLKEISFLKNIKSNVRYLELNRNLFDSLDLCCFSCLTELDVSNNQLTAIPLLAGCSALEKLWLTKNKIKEIKEFDLLDLGELKELQLGNNYIIAIHPKAFNGCFNLKVFDLSYNPITKFDFILPESCMLLVQR